jgi:hypothetical protein
VCAEPSRSRPEPPRSRGGFPTNDPPLGTARARTANGSGDHCKPTRTKISRGRAKDARDFQSLIASQLHLPHLSRQKLRIIRPYVCRLGQAFLGIPTSARAEARGSIRLEPMRHNTR